MMGGKEAFSAELMEAGKGHMQGAEGLDLDAAWIPTLHVESDLGREFDFPLSLLKFINREMIKEQAFRTPGGEAQERSCPCHGPTLLST